MAVNRTRDMRAEFEQGIVDNTYIQLYPNHGGEVETWNDDRMRWPTYGKAEIRPDPLAVCGGVYKEADNDAAINDNDADDNYYERHGGSCPG